MIDKFEYIKIKTFYSVFLKSGEWVTTPILTKSSTPFGGWGWGVRRQEAGKRQKHEFLRKGSPNVHKHEKVVSFISDQGNASKSHVTASHSLEWQKNFKNQEIPSVVSIRSCLNCQPLLAGVWFGTATLESNLALFRKVEQVHIQ